MINTTTALPKKPVTPNSDGIFSGPVLYARSLKINNNTDSHKSYLSFGDGKIAITDFEPNNLKNLNFDLIKLVEVDTRPYVISQKTVIHLDVTSGARKQLLENENYKKTSPYPIYLINSNIITAATRAEEIAATYPNFKIDTNVGYLAEYDGNDKDKLREHIAIIRNDDIDFGLDGYFNFIKNGLWFYEDDYLLELSNDNKDHTTYIKANAHDLVLHDNELTMLKDYTQPKSNIPLFK